MKKTLNKFQNGVKPIAVFYDSAQAGAIAAQICNMLNTQLFEEFGELLDFYFIDTSTDKKRHIQVYLKDTPTRVNDPVYLDRIKEAEWDGGHRQLKRKRGS